MDKKDSYVKELGHQMNIFLKAYEIKSIIHVHAQMVFTFLACLVQEKNKYKACLFENTYKY